MDSNMSIFTASGRKARTMPESLGISAHIDICRAWLKEHKTKQLPLLTEDMKQWTRAMPTATELCSYLPFGLYVH